MQFLVVVAESVKYSPLLSNTKLTTLEGGTVDIAVSDEGVSVDSVSVGTADVVTSNDVVHVMEAVLLQNGTSVP